MVLIPGLVKLESLKESPLEKNLKTGNGEVHDVPQRGPCWVQFCLFLGVGRLKDRKSLEIACFSYLAGGVVMPGECNMIGVFVVVVKVHLRKETCFQT